MVIDITNSVILIMGLYIFLEVRLYLLFCKVLDLEMKDK